MVTDEFRSRILQMLASPDKEMVELAITMWIATTRDYRDYWYLKKEWDETFGSTGILSISWCTKIVMSIPSKNKDKWYPLLVAEHIENQTESLSRRRQKENIAKFKPGRREIIEVTCQVKTKEQQQKKKP